LRSGTTVVASAEGRVRYVISKPMPSTAISEDKQKSSQFRVERQRGFVEQCDRSDPFLAWGDDDYINQRMALRMDFAAMHRVVPR